MFSSLFMIIPIFSPFYELEILRAACLALLIVGTSIGMTKQPFTFEEFIVSAYTYVLKFSVKNFDSFIMSQSLLSVASYRFFRVQCHLRYTNHQSKHSLFRT